MSLLDSLKNDFTLSINVLGTNISEIGNAIIIAPHQDDESLACGGTIACLTALGFIVNVVFITDGSQSHPDSILYPPERIIKIREQEAINALNILGVPENCIHFMKMPDAKMNELIESSKEFLIGQLRELFKKYQPKTIFLPWRYDPHADHKASWMLANDAIHLYAENNTPQILEYLVWFWERSQAEDLPTSSEVALWKVNVQEYLFIKRRAIDAHISQLGNLIKDSKYGFSLSEDMLVKFNNPIEYFFEYLH